MFKKMHFVDICRKHVEAVIIFIQGFYLAALNNPG